MTQPILPTGARVVGPAHAGVCGTWWRALAPDGTAQLVLRIAAPDPALADRVTTATRAVAALRHVGLPATGDPIRHNGALWLVAAGVSGSTLSELADSGGALLDLPAVATIAAETARLLTALHAAGLAHGAVHGRTVLVTAHGAVTLAEAALLPALRGEPADPATDRRAWAELVRWLVARWCDGQPRVDLLLRCVARGEQDLAQAVRELRDIPAGDLPTEALTLSAPTEALTLGVPTMALPDDAPTTALSMSPPVDPFVSTRVPTLLPDQPASPGRTYRSAGPAPTIPQPATVDAVFPGSTTTEGYEATGAPPSPDPVAEVRFGPGVPAGPPAAPAWPQPPAPPARPRRSRWRLVGSVLSALLTLALLVAVGLHLWQRMSPLEVRSVQVAVAEPPGERCDVTVDVVATVQTNGRAGTIRYQWLRGGAEPGGLLTQRVARGQRTVTLRLKWAFNGTGSATETAVVNIVEPTPIQGRTIFRYQCG
ncbi:hypothetical protein GA0074692_1418 [Micromonospora pallida]|uniref:Uncharacterized protein n=1 Tax=Micromonospora pallida TaxID=145854 RepID=A0A1C6RZX1_9ACTN|nr:hypothetical protein [Micromonospora pallida]SCL22578.1 hypothetical protein GA0074692_1418 [Micromonospora pallida]